MTVRELIAKLQEEPPETAVFVEEPAGDDGDDYCLRKPEPRRTRVRLKAYDEWTYVLRRKPSDRDVDGVIL